MHPFKHLIAVLLALSCSAISERASADTSKEDKAIADGLFKDGRRLFKEGKFTDACAKFEASQRLDPAAGTQLNLAACHFEEGKFATAYLELNEASARAKKDKRDDRLQIVEEYMAKLTSKLSRLVIKVETQPAGAQIAFDGRTLTEDAYGVEFPVDPGLHTISAMAPGYKPWNSSVGIGFVAETRTLTVSRLTSNSDAAPSPAPSAVIAKPVADAPRAEKPAVQSQPLRGWSLIVGGAGLVGVGIGSYWLLHSNALRSDAESTLAAGDYGGASALNEDAKSARARGWIGVGVGGALAATALVLFVVSSHHEDGATATWRVAPTFGANGGGNGGLSLEGQF